MRSFARSFLVVSILCGACVTSFPVHAEDGHGVPMLSGGVGEEDFGMMQNARSRFNTRLLFTETGGAYLSDVKVSVQTSSGMEIASTVTDGPVLLMRLTTGEYMIKASVSGYTKTQKLVVDAKKMNSGQIIFPIKDNVD